MLETFCLLKYITQKVGTAVFRNQNQQINFRLRVLSTKYVAKYYDFLIIFLTVYSVASVIPFWSTTIWIVVATSEWISATCCVHTRIAIVIYLHKSKTYGQLNIFFGFDISFYLLGLMIGLLSGL